jgi:hypothetical protein
VLRDRTRLVARRLACAPRSSSVGVLVARKPFRKEPLPVRAQQGSSASRPERTHGSERSTFCTSPTFTRALDPPRISA